MHGARNRGDDLMSDEQGSVSAYDPPGALSFVVLAAVVSAAAWLCALAPVFAVR